MIKKITQSFIKSMKAYQAGEECGHITKAQWIDEKLIELDSDSANLGAYFEYVFTLTQTGKGTVPKNGVVPSPQYMKSKNEMLAPYRLVNTNAKRLAEYFYKMGWKIVATAKKMTKGRFEGTVDLIVECVDDRSFDDISWKKDDLLVIDIKYSGLLDDKWSKHGWMWTDIQREYHGIQARQYQYITGLPFYFVILSSKNEDDAKVLHVPVTEENIKAHIAEANKLYEDLKLEEMMGFLPRPEVSRCKNCPLFEGCKDRHEFPHPKIALL